MATTKKAPNIVPFNPAQTAAKRVFPVLDKWAENTDKAYAKVYAEYKVLPNDGSKREFAEIVGSRYGWSAGHVQNIAFVGKNFARKAEIICSADKENISPQGEKFQPEITVAKELCSVPDDLLRKAAAAGMFDRAVTAKEVATLKTTGRIPPKNKREIRTDIDKIRKLMGTAEDHMRKASNSVGKIASLMYDSGITDATGKEATAFIKTFEKLCTEVASVNPVTSRRAFQILRGEA